MSTFTISDSGIQLAAIPSILKQKISLSDASKAKVQACRDYLDKKIETEEKPIYGITTGFGSLCNTSISRSELEQLQRNLVLSHACGTGEKVPSEIVKLMLLLKVQGLSYGHSGVAVSTIERLIDLYNNDVLPVVYQQGSLGASGDLAPLAHLSLPLFGEGEVEYKGATRASAEVLQELNLAPITLRSKEGLALLNGTQFMSSYGVYSCLEAQRLSQVADLTGAISLEGFDGRLDPFGDDIHLVRKQGGQLKTAQAIRSLLEGSEIIAAEKKHVQDPYSFRCIPQVHGASKDAFAYVSSVIEKEINSVTDNPTIFPEKDLIVSGGNFHGQPLAMALDYLSIALAELGSISERRVYKLVSGQRGLPEFLVSNPGLNSGFMIPQYTAAGIVSQNKQYCTPASVDSVDSSNGQEDHVSMGANAATKCYKVLDNLKTILGIEILNGTQALEFRRPLKSSPKLEAVLADFRQSVPNVKEDRWLHIDIKNARTFIESLYQQG